jgi:hypothetical protein
MPNAAQIATQFVPVSTGAAVVCANTAGLASNTPASAPAKYRTFLISSSYELPPRGGSRTIANHPISLWNGRTTLKQP